MLAIITFLAANAMAQNGPIIGPKPLPFANLAIGVPQSLGTSSVNGATMTTSAPILANNLVIVCTWGESSGAPTAVSDGTNTYTEATSFLVGSTEPSSMWYKANAAAVTSGATITVTYSASITDNVMTAYQVANIQTVSPLDKTAANGNGSSGTSTATTSTLSQKNEIAAGCSGGAAASALAYNGASGFSQINNKIISLFGTAGDYEIVTATTAVSYSPSWSGGSPASAALVATFKGH